MEDKNVKLTTGGGNRFDHLKYNLNRIYKKFENICLRKLYKFLKGSYQKKKIDLPSVIESQAILDKYRKHENNRCGANNVIGEKKYDLTIIVPVYNVEGYIEYCLDSIFNQNTKYRYLVKAVDDGSTDNTAEILEKYSHVQNLEIIRKPNGGLSSARNAGIKKLNSTYVLFVDSDDILLPESIDKLCSFAFKNNLDIVEGGYNNFNNDGVIDSRVHDNKIILDNYMSGGLFGFSWGKLYRSELFRGIKFNESYLFEDTIGIYILYPLAKRIGHISDITYGYRRNPNGIMQSLKNTTKGIDSYLITAQLLDDIEYYKLPVDKQYLYDITLSQIVTNYQRTKFLKADIQKSIFVLSCNLLRKYFVGYKASDDKYKDLEASLKDENYRLYELFCKVK